MRASGQTQTDKQMMADDITRQLEIVLNNYTNGVGEISYLSA